MKYTKPPLTFEEQAEKLINRGLESEKKELIQTLQSVSYYRLSGYLYPFRNNDDTYKNGTTLNKIWRNYTFDRQLRLLILDGIERFETALKTDVIYLVAHKYGAFAYLEHDKLPKISGAEHQKFINRIREETTRSKELFVRHFNCKYGDTHRDLPLWMAGEVMSFGNMHTLFRGMAAQDKKDIAEIYKTTDRVLLSWIGAIHVVRNICAHHGRLFNRILGYKPDIPKEKKHPQWHTPVSIDNDKIFSILSIIHYLLKIKAPRSRWKQRLADLLDLYSEIPLRIMGFPEDWGNHELWK